MKPVVPNFTGNRRRIGRPPGEPRTVMTISLSITAAEALRAASYEAQLPIGKLIEYLLEKATEAQEKENAKEIKK